MTESRKQTDRLRQLQELRAFLDTQIEELTARENHRQLELCCSADKTLAGARGAGIALRRNPQQRL